jgi:hypothetical protein
MPVNMRSTTPMQVPAAAYWALRLDRGFDLFCAEADGSEYTCHSETEDEDENGDTVVIIESTTTYARSTVPGPILSLLPKDEPFRIWSRFHFWSDLFDKDHLATFETRPSILSGKLVVSGDVWCESTTEGACQLHTHHCVSCKVFGIGGVVEAAIASQVSLRRWCSSPYPGPLAHV